MKILLINRNHFVNGGADKVYFNTGKLLSDNGHEVMYFSTKNTKNELNDFEEYFVEELNVENTSAIKKVAGVRKYLYNNDVTKNLSKLLEKFNPDVAHIHLFYGKLSASLLVILKEYKIPVVITIHDYRLLCPANAMLDKDGKICEKCYGNRFYNCVRFRCSHGDIFQSVIIGIEAYLRTIMYNPLDLVSHFIFVSEFSKKKHIAYNHMFAPKSTHLYNFSATDSNSEKSRGNYFLYYGRLSREKGIVNLINACRKTGFNLIIAGSGPLQNFVEMEVIECPNIEYVGFKSGPNLKELIVSCSFVIVPSEWYENNPMTIVESFSLGKPVIGANIGGIPELINSETGFVFNAGNEDSLIKTMTSAHLLSDEMYSEFCESCVKFAQENFNDVQHLTKLLGIYENVISDDKIKN